MRALLVTTVATALIAAGCGGAPALRVPGGEPAAPGTDRAAPLTVDRLDHHR